MGREQRFTEDDVRSMSQKEFRKKLPSGWMEVARYETLVLAIDALLESPPTREFTIREISKKAGVSERSLKNHIRDLEVLGVIQELEGREPVRFSLNERNPITQKLYELNVTVERVKEGDLPKELVSSPSRRVVEDHGNRFMGASRSKETGSRREGSFRFDPSQTMAQ